MKLKVLALCLGMLFFGSIASTSVAAVVDNPAHIVVVDDDKDKNKKTAKKDAKAKKDCAKKKSCCKSSSYEKSCKDKDGKKK